MSGKRFGALDLVAATEAVLMSGLTGTNSTVNVRLVNRNSTQVKVRLALVDAPAATALTALADEDYLEYDTVILGNEVLENTGIVVPEDFSLVARSDSNDVTCIAFGFEEQIV